MVLLDVMLPGGQDGISVCRELRADAAFEHTSVVMLSALGASADRRADWERAPTPTWPSPSAR